MKQFKFHVQHPAGSAPFQHGTINLDQTNLLMTVTRNNGHVEPPPPSQGYSYDLEGTVFSVEFNPLLQLSNNGNGSQQISYISAIATAELDSNGKITKLINGTLNTGHPARDQSDGWSAEAISPFPHGHEKHHEAKA